MNVKQTLRYLLRWARLHDWKGIRRFGNSWLVTSSLLWLILVPVAAKILLPIAGTYCVADDLRITRVWTADPKSDCKGGTVWDIGLPFSWKLSYAMAIFFLAGQMIFHFRCPSIIRSFGSLGEFMTANPFSAQRGLYEYMNEATKREDAAEYKTILREFMDDPRLGGLPTATEGFLEQARYRMDQHAQTLYDQIGFGTENQDDRGKFGGRFDAIMEAANEVRHLYATLSGACFAVGLGLFGWLLIEGFIYVLRVALP